MSENTFDSQEINLQFQPLPAFIDSDGAFKLNTPMLSSFNFDGSIPKFDGNIDAIDIKPGYLIQTEVGGQYYPVISVESDDPAIESTGFVTINYIDESGNTVSEEYSETDQVAVVYENWSEKILGSQGWGITAEGNAIFTNVAVRGRIEATEGEISGNLIVNGGLLTSETASSTGGIILNNSGFTAYNSSGSQTFNINSTTGEVTIGGYASDSELSSGLSGKINNGGAATDVNSNVTTISGGKIRTGSIESQFYSYTSGLYSDNGMQINLDSNGYIRSPNFYIDTSGNANFRGDVTAKSGYFGNSSYGMSIVDDGSTVTLRTTTMRVGSQLVSGTLHGKINFYNTSGTSLGSISSAASDKTTYLLGDGLTVGTPSDYIFLPSAANANRARFLGSAFEFRNTSGYKIMSIAGGGGGFKIFDGSSSQNEVASISLTGVFTGDGSGLTNVGGGSSIPSGTITMYGGTSAPSGWLLCNGQEVSRSTYSNLWNVIGTSFGNGNGSTTFNVPNFVNGGPGGNPAFPRGGNTVGNTGGQASFTLTESNIPQHNHGVGTLETLTAGSHQHNVTVNDHASHTHGVGNYTITGSTGSGGSHSHTYTAPNNAVTGRSGTGSLNVVPNNTAGTSTSTEPSHQHGAGTLALSGTSGGSGALSHSGSLDSKGDHNHTISGNTGNWGTATPSSINNQPPYITVNFIIKT